MVVNMTKDKFYKIVLYIKNLINGTKFDGKTYVVGGVLYVDKTPVYGLCNRYDVFNVYWSKKQILY